jgi:protein SCO1/2
MIRIVAVLLVLGWSTMAAAGLSESQIAEVMLQPPLGARVPNNLNFMDIDGHSVTLGQAIAGRPTLLLPADFTCKEICGPALTVAADALGRTGLQAGKDYSVVVVGLDPQDDLSDARRFVAGQIGGPGVAVLTGSADAIGSLMSAIGYRYSRDTSNDAIAHPAGLVALTADGRVAHALSSLALQPTDLRLALIEAGEGRVGGLAGRLALLCYGFDAVHGVYTRKVVTLLQVAGGITVALMAAGIGLLLWRTRRRETSA